MTSQKVVGNSYGVAYKSEGALLVSVTGRILLWLLRFAY